MSSGVYALVNETKDIYYIGSSENVEARIKTHFSQLKNRKHICKAMQEDFANGDKFTSRILEELPLAHRKVLFNKESKWISEQSKTKNLYNKAMLCEKDLFVSQRQLELLMLDCFCKAFFNKTYHELTSCAESAEIEMLYRIIQEPLREAEIREEYKEVISYQNRKRYFRCL